MASILRAEIDWVTIAAVSDKAVSVGIQVLLHGTQAKFNFDLG